MSLTVALDARLAGRDATGDSTYWTGLLHGLSERNSSNRYLLLSNGEAPPGIPEGPRFRWITVPARSSRWWSLVRFPLAARQLGADVIHTQYNLSPLVGARGVTTIHDVSFFIGPEWFRPRDRYLLQRFVPRSARRAARVIAVSEISKTEIERYIPAARGKVRVALNGPNPAIAHTVPDVARARVASELGIREPFLLTVGTRWPRKNMKLAIEACERLPKDIPHLLALTGKPGWGEENLGGRTRATGFVSEAMLSCLYSSASVYLAPSRHEGFGITLVEAFACGCPVICSAGGAHPEVAGDAAEVLDSWDPEDWASRISSLLGDSSKLDSMRERGFRRARDFSWRTSAERHEQAYAEVAR